MAIQEEDGSCLGCLGILLLLAVPGTVRALSRLDEAQVSFGVWIVMMITFFVALGLWALKVEDISGNERRDFHILLLIVALGIGLPSSALLVARQVDLTSLGIMSCYVILIVVGLIAIYIWQNAGLESENTALLTGALLVPVIIGVVWLLRGGMHSWEPLVVTWMVIAGLMVGGSVWAVSVWDMAHSQLARFYVMFAGVIAGIGLPVSAIALADVVELPKPAVIGAWAMLALGGVLLYAGRNSKYLRSSSPGRAGAITAVLLIPALVGLMWLTRDTMRPWLDWLLSHFGS